MTGYLFVALAMLVAVAGWRIRHRLRHQTRSGVKDEIVLGIEAVAHVDAEDVEPLDLERVRTEEDEFWAQDCVTGIVAPPALTESARPPHP